MHFSKRMILDRKKMRRREIPEIPHEDIIHPEHSITKYGTFVLDNGLSVLVVSSPECHLATTAVAVNCGSFADPPNEQGVAHLLEHVLFLGSKQYPAGANELKDFVERNGGDVYASTRLDSSVFSIGVFPDKLDVSLKMFADFFSNPVMDQELIRKELTVVDSEFKLHLCNDTVRYEQLICHTASKQHPFHMFAFGNKDSLSSSPNVLKLFEDYYIASNMKLVIISPLGDLDSLKHLASSHFSKLPRRERIGGSQTFLSTNKIWETGVAYVLESLEDSQSIRLSWVLPPNEYGASRPEKLIFFLLGQENEGSVCYVLKCKGWVTKFTVQVGDNASFEREVNWDYNSTSAGQLFTIVADLTNIGWKKRYELVAYVFEYFNLLRVKRPSRLLLKEYTNILSMKYFGLEYDMGDDSSAFAQVLAGNMLKRPAMHALSLEFLYDFGGKAEMDELLTHLTPQNMRLDLLSKPFTDKVYETEPYYNAKYKKVVIPEQYIKTWQNKNTIDSSLYFPSLNKFMPSSFFAEVKRVSSRYKDESSSDEVDGTFVICSDDFSTKLLHREDNSVLVSSAYFNIYTNVSNIKGQIFTEMIKEDLSAISLSGEDAYIKMSISFGDNNILELRFEGFHEKLEDFISEVWKRIRYFMPRKEHFQNIKDEMQREFPSRNLAKQALQLLSNALREGKSSLKDKCELLANTTHEDLIDFSFSKIRVVGVCSGNLSMETSKQIVGVFNSTGDFHISKEVGAQKLTLIPGRPFRINVKPRNQFETNSLAEVFFQMSPEEKYFGRDTAFLAILQASIRSYLYRQLRQKEQLGYEVNSDLYLNGTRGFFLYVVSASHKPHALLERIYNFIGTVTEFLDGVDEMCFESYKRVAYNLLPSDSGICDELIHDLSCIQGRMKMAVSSLDNMQKDEVIDLVKEYFTKESCRSIEVCITADADEE